MSVGQPVAIYGVTNCAGLNATQTVTAITSATLTVNYDSSSCSSPTGGSVYSEDVVFRATRYVGNGPYWSLEIWNADSTGYEFATNTTTSVSDIYLPNSDSINAIPAAPDMAYFRWCGGTIAQGSQAPWGGAGQACPGGTTLADWEFEDSSTTSAADSSGNGITMSFGPAVTHVITPVYNPACVPTSPTDLIVAVGNGSVALSWVASSGATSYSVYRGTMAGGESATAVAAGIMPTSYSDNGLSNGSSYYYKVAAVNAGGTSAQSGEASIRPSRELVV
jgi:hypothetical protein